MHVRLSLQRIFTFLGLPVACVDMKLSTRQSETSVTLQMLDFYRPQPAWLIVKVVGSPQLKHLERTELGKALLCSRCVVSVVDMSQGNLVCCLD